MRANFLKQQQQSPVGEQGHSSSSVDEEKKGLFPVEAEDLSVFCLGRCCQREACYFATPQLQMRFCPYCATEMKTVYDFFAMFQLSSNEPFSLEPAKKRYRQLLSMFHPDLDENQSNDEKSAQKGDYTNDFLLISQGWQTLGSDDLRQEYRKMLAKCRTALLMEQDFAGKKKSEKNPSSRSLFFSLRAVNVVLAGLCLGISILWLYGYWGKVWHMLGGISCILLTIVSFSLLYKIFSIAVGMGLCAGFFYFFGQEKWPMTGLFFVLLVLFLHFGKKWKDAARVQRDCD